VKEYNCKTTCIDIIKASCHIPIISGITPYYINGEGFFDGDLSKMPDDDFFGTKVEVDIRSGDNKICPGLDLPDIWAYYPADPFVLKSLYQLGYMRANQYIYERLNTFVPFLKKECREHDLPSIIHLHEILVYSMRYTDICTVRSPLKTLWHIFPKRITMVLFALYILFNWKKQWIRLFFSRLCNKNKTRRLQ
jgi:hypothetical protein